MNAQHPIRNPRVLLGISMLLCAALIIGCQEIPVAPNADDVAATETIAAAKKCETPPCGGGGGGGDDGGNGFTVEMTGFPVGEEVTGLIALPQVLGTFKENKQQISGKLDDFEVELNLVKTRMDALADQTTCSFTCDDAAVALAGLVCNDVFKTLADAFVSPSQLRRLNVGFDLKAVDEEAPKNCPFTGIAAFEPASGGGVVIRNCIVAGNIQTKTYIVKANGANTVSTGQRFETDGDPGSLGPQDYRASLVCPLREAFTVTFAPEL